MDKIPSHIQINPLIDDIWGWSVWFGGDEQYDGKALSLDDAMLAIKSKINEVNGTEAVIARLKELLHEAHPYLQDKFQETGSGNAVLSRIEHILG